MTNAQAQEHQDHRFLIGLITGGVLAVGAMIFGPRLIALLRDNMCDAVAHGAQEVERYATEAKTDHPAETETHSAAFHSTSARHAR